MPAKPATVTGSPTSLLRIRVPYAGHPPSVNATMRLHGTAAHALLDPWATAATIAASDYKGIKPLPTPSLVRVTFPMPTNTRRDAHNYVGTICKAIIDGLVRARLWDDDTAKQVVSIDPRIVVIPEMKDPKVLARAVALVDIVPLARLLNALRTSAPELAKLFQPADE